MNDIILHGCRPVPLAHYLKALGILRLVSEQADPSALGWWDRDRFILRTTLDFGGVIDFFLEEYRPTPVIAPWNGGSGFFPNDNKRARTAIEASSSERFGVYRKAIADAAALLGQLGIHKKVDAKDKPDLLRSCRARLPDEFLEWIDAALVLTDAGPKYPPLLGTGGNDGRLDFTNNFMQRLTELIDTDAGGGPPASRALLIAALGGTVADNLSRCAIGQFLPGDAGGANASAGFDDDSLVNAWDFVLMIEGAVLFAAAAVRKLESTERGALSFPFTVRQAGVGYGTASAADEANARAEMWIPLWDKPASVREIRNVFAEGRARVGRRAARNGVDFARAIASLGTDRGIASFQRYGFQVRNGLAYFATPLNRFEVGTNPLVSLVHEVDRWLDDFRKAARGDNAPTAADSALRALETSIIELCQRGDSLRLEAVFVNLGRCERAMANSLAWSVKGRLDPVSALSPTWLEKIDTGSLELRLAASLASVSGKYPRPSARQQHVPLRCQLEPVATQVVNGKLRATWDPNAHRDVAWSESDLCGALCDIMARRLMMAGQTGVAGYPDTGRAYADLADIADFIEGRVDEQRFADLLWSCALINWPEVKSPLLKRRQGSDRLMPTALYSLLKLCFPGGWQDTEKIPVVPRIHRLAAMGDGAEASRAAVKRLRASGHPPGFQRLHATGVSVKRIAAALLFPVGCRDLAVVARRVLRPEPTETDERAPVTHDQGAAQ